ncbi:hypothetical protein GC175_17110 [bacterium]|nr:hypothetical protein [bacterium]
MTMKILRDVAETLPLTSREQLILEVGYLLGCMSGTNEVLADLLESLTHTIDEVQKKTPQSGERIT